MKHLILVSLVLMCLLLSGCDQPQQLVVQAATAHADSVLSFKFGVTR